MKYPAVRMAMVAFAITIVWTLIEHGLGYNTEKHEIGQYTRLLTAFVFYFLVVRAIWLQKEAQGNIISFAQGLKTGAATAVIYGALAAVWFMLYAELINPAFGSTLRAFELKKLEAAHASAEQIAARMKEVEMSYGGSFLSYFLLFVFMTLFGFVVALVASLLLRTPKRKG